MKKLLFAFAALAVALLGSCSRDRSQDGHLNPATTLHLSVSVKGMTSEAATRGTIPAETGEDQLGTLYLMFFTPDTYQQGQFVDYVQVTGPLAMNANIPIDLSGHPLLSASAAYDILALGNVTDNTYLGDNVATWMAQWGGQTEAQVMESTATVKGSSDNDSNAIAPDAILMNGRLTKSASDNNLQLVMTRNVSRFDVYNDSSVSVNYDLFTASIWNAYPQSSIFGSGVIDYSKGTTRIHRYYGVDNSTNTQANGTLGNIIGGLYCFENQYYAPGQNDNMTTCLILGIRDRAAGTLTYYRANVAAPNSAQSLRRNNVYRLTIKGLTGPGYATEELAYNGRGNNLIYTVTSWNLDDNGLIVQDENSILSLPTKTINIGRPGGESDYSIYISSKLPNPAPLSIVSQTYSPADGGIVASINGNILHIDASPLAIDQTERRGVVILSYAGLQTSVNIYQSGDAETYLTVKLPDGGIPPFPPYSNAFSGMVTVDASGPWTAQIYMDGFSFTQGQLVTTVHSTDVAYVNNNQFRIYTNTANPETTARSGFVVVSLDSDPNNYSSVVRVSQKAAGAIKVNPNQTIVTYDGNGNLVAPVSPATNTNTFNVLPNVDAGGFIPDWTYSIIQSGSYDDRAMFTVPAASVTKSTTNTAGNNITVNAAGSNITGRSYVATLRISLTDDPGTYTDITLTQQSLTLTLSPTTLSPVTIAGGQTSAVTVQADASLRWSATVVTNSGTASDGRKLVHHAATLVDQNGNAITADGTTTYPMTTQFKVVFPKVYYPNRDISISATVTVKVQGITQTMTATQTTLTAKNAIGYGLNGGPSYGGVGSIYDAGWEGRNNGGYAPYNYPGSSPTGLSSITGWAWAAPQTGGTASVVPSNVTYLQAAIDGAGATFNWSNVNNFMSTVDGWTVITVQDNAGIAPINNANSPLKMAGYPNNVYGGANYARLFTGQSSTKLYQFLMDKGHTPITDPNSVADFYSDGVSITMSGTMPSTGVVLMTRNNNTAQAMLVIDIKNKFMWIGESQIFWYNAYLNNNRGVYLDNMMYFIGNAIRYGTNFTDLLRDDLSVPAPWDSYWGANAGVPTK